MHLKSVTTFFSLGKKNLNKVINMCVTLKNVLKIYDIDDHNKLHVIQDINIEVAKNEFISIVGPSGCGKSTLLKLIAGLEEVTCGSIEICGKIITGPGSDRGMVFQSYTLFPWLTVAENIGFALKKSKLSKKSKKERILKYIAQIGLKEFKDAYPNQLSGGMRQRVAIARAMALKPKVLLMDEPFGALDAQTRMFMQELLLKIWDLNRTTVLFVTHDVEEAILLSDRIYVMTSSPGRIKKVLNVNLDRPRSIFNAQMHDVTNKLESKILKILYDENPMIHGG